jgi:hypothetical protein
MTCGRPVPEERPLPLAMLGSSKLLGLDCLVLVSLLAAVICSVPNRDRLKEPLLVSSGSLPPASLVRGLSGGVSKSSNIGD